MKSIYSLTRNFKSSSLNRTEDNIAKNLISKKKISIYSRDKMNKYQPLTKNTEYNKPFPFRSFVDFSSNTNNMNLPTEEEKNSSNYPKPEQSRYFPLITRQDLLKYLKKKGELLKFKKHCVSCEKLREENEKNYLSTLDQSNLPAITGRSLANKYKIIHRYKTPLNPQNKVSNLKYKFINFNTNRSNSQMNLLTNSCNIHPLEERKNDSTTIEECDKSNDIPNLGNDSLNVVSRNYTKRFFYKPKIRINFRKTQIFNNFKPYLVDEFHDYGAYE